TKGIFVPGARKPYAQGHRPLAWVLVNSNILRPVCAAFAGCAVEGYSGSNIGQFTGKCLMLRLNRAEYQSALTFIRLCRSKFYQGLACCLSLLTLTNSTS